MECFALFQELAVWTSTQLVRRSASYDSTQRRWNVKVTRRGEEIVLKPKHLILATGVIDHPATPQVKGADDFKGQILHSKAFKNAKSWRDKKVVVVGLVCR